MRYKSFRIQNFKGIKDTTIGLEGIAGANVFAFVGLNESGKTTALEAIHSFHPDAATSELLGGAKGTGVPFRARVPRHLISEFTDDVNVTATLSLSPEEREEIIAELRSEYDLIVDPECLPDEIVIENRQRFENGDFIDSTHHLLPEFRVKGKRQKNWREPDDNEIQHIFDTLYDRAPHIAYFPTFVFNFPESFFLSERGGPVDKFYRRVFQDILDYDGRGHTIEKDIIRRIRRDDMIIPWLSFFQAWSKGSDRDKIQHVMDRASSAVTKLVFGRWNKIFGEHTRGKEIAISFEMAEGEKRDTSGAIIKTHEHDVIAKFQIKDGTRRFNVNDRSLGFRWFFSFMLFTQFRVARSSGTVRPLLFLFDEPASNLHAAAQQKLIESFPEIAKNEHVLIYSTHSHYMIEPKWLEQTFIVTNRSDNPGDSVLDEASLDDESLDVRVTSYRSFVNDHPSQVSYFQPILDRLEVVPSKFDAHRPSIVLEGKSDYYILRYAAELFNISDLPLLPGLGAGTFGALAALHAGWNLNFLFVLDGDKQGKTERVRYASEFGLRKENLATIDELAPGITIIEDLLDDRAMEIICSELKLPGPLGKGPIRRFFQERLASGNVKPLGKIFEGASRSLLAELRNRLKGTC